MKNKLCLECRCELKSGMNKKYTNNNYCSEWCFDFKKPFVFSKCKKCGDFTEQQIRKDKNRHSINNKFRILCNKCFIKKGSKEESLYRKCKKCNTVKNIKKDFYTNSINKSHICKECKDYKSKYTITYGRK